MVVLLAALVLAAPAGSAAGRWRAKKPPAAAAAKKAPLCEGDYADAVPASIASQVLDGVREQFVFAVRNTATYEHVYYGRDGKLRHAYVRSVVHGTGFAYRVRDGETLIITNQHVAERPEVTDDEHPVDGVPAGSKKVREQLKIVRNEDDDYEPGHVALAKVLSDAAADIAIVKAHKLLPPMPFRFGRSSALRPGNLVQVRGFPLGAFSAVSVGKVVNPYTEDTEKGWSHSDFVVDALLSAGNSGSPVFAVSCRSSEPELVGVFHAGYADAAALNVDFPMVTRESLALVDRSQSGFGTLDTVVVLVDGAPAEVPGSALEPEMRDHFEKLYDALWHQLLGVVEYRARLSGGRQSADAFAQAQQARARLRKKVPEQKEQLGLAMFEADRVGTVAKAVAASPSSPPTTAAALSTPDQ